MARFGRTTWTTLLFVALLAPFVAMVVFSTMWPAKQTGRPASAQLVGMPSGAGAVAAPGNSSAADARLLAAGDGKTLWLVRPTYAEKDNTVPAYEVLQRTSNTGIWNSVRINDEFLFSGFPRAVAAIGTNVSGRGKGTALVMTDGEVESFTSDEMFATDGLPRDHLLLAATGSEDGAFALTVGTPPESATRPGDRLDVTAKPPATAPATASNPGPSPQVVNGYWYKNGHWIMLPAMGQVAKGTEHFTPRLGAKIALAQTHGRLIAIWADAIEPRTLVARSLDYEHAASWSAPALTKLQENISGDTKLLPATLDESVYVFWPVATATSLSLHGGRLVTHEGSPENLTLPRENQLPPMALSPSGDDIRASANVALATVENSFAVIVSKGDDLTCTVFNNRGEEISKPTLVEVQSPRHRVQVLQNVTMLLFLMVMVLAIWQWQQRPAGVKLPAGMKIGPLYLRAIAFAIDFGIAMAGTAVIFGLWEMSPWQALFGVWTNAFVQPEELLNSPEILTLLAIYIGQVMLGELFFRRSIGKAITGLQVLMADGKSPTVAAVLLRNLVRIVEIVPGILMLNVLISTHRQRIGDFLAGTVVVAATGPVMPEDPDAAEKPEAEKLREKEKV